MLEPSWAVGYSGDIINPSMFVIPGKICARSKKQIWFHGGAARGMSGGAIINRKNKVIGICTRLLTVNGKTSDFVCSIPPNVFKHLLGKYTTKAKIRNFFFGK